MTIAHKLLEKGFTRDIYTAAGLIFNGIVYINNELCENPLTEVKSGDTVAIARKKVFTVEEQNECL